MAGTKNDVLVGKNADFTQVNAPNGSSGESNGLFTDGKIWIGSTALNVGGTHINVGSLTSPNSSLSIGYSSPNITIQTGQAVATQYTENSGVAVPVGNNLNVLGTNSALTGYSPWSTGAASTITLNMPGTVKWVVNATANLGTHTTIQAAVTAAASGDDVFITPGTYTENITLKAGVNLVSYGTDSSLNNTGIVKILGTLTFTGAGTVTISGMQLQTNGAAFLAVTGSAASVVNIINCNLNCSNATGITYSAANTSSAVNIYDCVGDMGTTGISFATVTSTGSMRISYTNIDNTGNSTTATTTSACTISSFYSSFSIAFSTSSTGALNFFQTIVNTPTINTVCMLAAGTGSIGAVYCYLASGTASAFSIGSGCTGNLHMSNISSSNANAITGAGTFNGSCNNYSGSSFVNNVTTQTNTGIIQGLRSGNAPTAGMVGEQIRGFGSAVAVLNGTPKTITSISITPGVWDVSAQGYITYTSNAATIFVLAIGTTTDSFAGTTVGDNYYQFGGGVLMGQISGSVASFRVTLAATTTYYCVAQGNFPSGTAAASCRISASRVG